MIADYNLADLLRFRARRQFGRLRYTSQRQEHRSGRGKSEKSEWELLHSMRAFSVGPQSRIGPGAQPDYLTSLFTRFLNTGNKSFSNQGFFFSHAVLRQLGCGSGRKSGR